MTPTSVLEAIRQGQWDYEPEEPPLDDYEPTAAVPGSREKLEALARRIQSGLPLWHPDDRRDREESGSAARNGEFGG